MRGFRRPFPLTSAVVLVILSGRASLAAPPGPGPGGPPDAEGATKPAIKLTIRREKLENGLRVVLAPDHSSPTIAVDVVYDVGARNEQPGRSGFAHLFEHMMFQGSRNVAKGEHFKLVSAHGGSMNGTTSEDRTNYFDLLPRSELPLALWLEADRMKSLDVSEKNFENQRAVVKEEYRMRVENAAYVPADIRLGELVFDGYWPYAHPAIGSMKDLDSAKLDWVRAFHSAYYAPNNAVLAIAGDIDADEALELTRQFFGDAKPVHTPSYAPPPDPPAATARTETVPDVHAKLAALFDGWRVPARGTPEHYALDMAGAILADGDTARLSKLLVRERSLCVSVDAGTSGHRGPDEFEVEAKLARGAKIDEVERLVEGEIARLRESPPTPPEMAKVKTRLEAHFVLGLQSNFARAQKLAEYELYDGNAELLNAELGRYLSVTPEEVRAAAAKYLAPEQRARVVVRPDEREDAPGSAPQKEGI